MEIVEYLQDLPRWALPLIVAAAVAVFLLTLKAVYGREGRRVKFFGFELGARSDRASSDGTELPGPLEPADRWPGNEIETAEPSTHQVPTSVTGWEKQALQQVFDHGELLSAEKTVDRIRRPLLQDGDAWAVTVTGAGGIGKTAVTYEAVKQLESDGRFDQIIWASARDTVIRSDGLPANQPTTVDWNDILQKIAQQLGIEAESKVVLGQRISEHVTEHSTDVRRLLVIDNLEGIQDARSIMNEVRALGFTKPHRLIAVSRFAVDSPDGDLAQQLDFRPVDVPALSFTDTLRLVRRLADSEANADLQTADDELLRPIYEISEGNPFLIKLIVVTYFRRHRPLSAVIDQLRSAQHDMGARVRSHLYEQAVVELATQYDARAAFRLMSAFTYFARGAAPSRQDLQARSRIQDDDLFGELVEGACRLFLVIPSNLKQNLSVHSLLYEYLREVQA
ncbi:AAA family ATPase [Kribbella sp. NPDC058245]|uniref:AAA family ATPase n=1 Tax=Kribbella sp. NPDC058245 TaxID=3346399 RepID=UPI0036EFF494